MDDFEEALQNIDVFCKVLVEKIVDSENQLRNNIVVEPIEKLLYKKYVINEQVGSSPIKHLIPLPHLEEPLLDIFEDDNYVKILMQCRCRDQKVTVHTNMDGLQICKTKCHTDAEGREICVDECRRLDLPVERLNIGNMVMKCNNNEAFEIDIPKIVTTVTY